MEIQQTLEYLLKAIVEDADSVNVETTTLEDGTINFLINARTDLIGQIIGKQGKIIKSIRTLLNLAYPNIRYNLDIKD